jgi:hypothetical protein
VRADAGDGDVILRLRPGGSIEGTVVDATSGAGCLAELACMPTSATRTSSGVLTTTRADGSFSVSALELGPYDLVARVDDGRTAVLRGVLLGSAGSVTGLVLVLEPGARLRIRYEGSAPYGWFDVRRDGVRVVHNAVAQGTTSVQIVPRGKLTIEMSRGPGTQTQVREVEIAAGEDKEIVFPDEP